MMPPILGWDIGQDQLQAVRLRAGHDPQPAPFPNPQAGFQQRWRFLKKRPSQHAPVALEATGLYSENVAAFLHPPGATVSVVNPARIKAYAASQLARNQTDQRAARTSADFGCTQHPAAWTPPAAAGRHWRALARQLADVPADWPRQRTRLHALEQAAQPVTTGVAQLTQQLERLEAQRRPVKHAINDPLNQHPDLKHDRERIASSTGIGDRTAGNLLAEFHNLRWVDKGRQLVAFAGLKPRHHQAGSSIGGQRRSSKLGRASSRATLYLPAIVAQTHKPVLPAFAQRREQRGLCPLQVLVAVLRKLLHWVYGVLKSGQPFDRHYLETVAAVA